MSDEKFVYALIILVFAVVFVIGGVAFLVIKNAKRSKNGQKMPRPVAPPSAKPASPTSEPKPKQKIKTVYASPKGQRYHYDPFCFTHDESNCISMTIEQAVKKGLTPCPKCIK